LKALSPELHDQGRGAGLPLAANYETIDEG